ncbi:hypothetical protein DTA24_14220 [Klebsiella sp. P1CD1]|nr:hypothetical protein DTA24_14220 [Klebsiella sp. P1CD1]
MLGELAIGFDFNVRSWHRADKLPELKVRYERGADIANSVLGEPARHRLRNAGWPTIKPKVRISLITLISIQFGGY